MAVIEAPGYNERVLIVGANGSGKSVFAEQLLTAGYARTVTFDLKREFEPRFRYDEKVWILTKPSGLAWKQAIKRGHIIYRPEPQFRSREALDAVFEHLYYRAQQYGKRFPFVIYLDEGLSIAKMGKSPFLESLIIEGRSMQVGMWFTSQRPLWIPVEIRSEAWRWYVFYLGYQDDMKEVIKYAHGRLSVEELDENMPDFGFWEIRRMPGGRVRIQKYPPVALEV